MRILNFGSLNLDYTYRVPHFAAPGETLSALSLTKNCGGKGLNQSVALARAGACVYHAGAVGTEGKLLVNALEAAGADTHLIKVEQETATGHAIIQITPDGQNDIILFAGANGTVNSEYIDRVLDEFAAGDFILLQNEISGCEEIMRKAAQRGMIPVLNPSPVNDALLHWDLSPVAWFILNEVEGAQLSGQDEPDKMLDVLCEKYAQANFVLTLGQDGAVYAHGKTRIRQPAYTVPVVDTTAAGDTFTGYFVANVLEGKDIQKSLQTASKAAALAVGRIGASPSVPLREEVEKFV